jgi:hypothetical protein
MFRSAPGDRRRVSERITTEKIGPGKARINGYVRVHFKEAFDGYLGPEARTERDKDF